MLIYKKKTWLKLWLIRGAFLLVGTFSAFICEAQSPKVRRICRSGVNNTLFFFPLTDTCSHFVKYNIWGRIGNTTGFSLLDSIPAKNADEYIHINANSTGTPSWNYVIESVDSCSGSLFSDTVDVDVVPPYLTIIDSVSVDESNQKIVMGWRNNNSPDFKNFLAYRDSIGQLRLFSDYQYRDTLIIDSNPVLNPENAALTYYLTVVDSCGNPQTFDQNRHTTIHLGVFADTCLLKANLAWSHYRGWPDIRSYHIFTKTDSGYLLIDSVAGNINSYQTDISLGDSFTYFVRAIKDTSAHISSSSARITITTRKRIDPATVYLANVSAINPDKNNIEITVFYPDSEEVKTVTVISSTEPDFSLFQKNSTKTTLNQSGFFYINEEAHMSFIQHIRIESANLCNQITHISNQSSTIIATGSGNGSTNHISWNSYPGWDSPILGYDIYRGTDVDGQTRTYEKIESLIQDTFYEDKNLPEKIGSFGLCYYIEAIQSPGGIHGITGLARSFSTCILGEMIVFFPNAFVPKGINHMFRPEGSYINYDRSILEIFDRWGGRVRTLNGILLGWDGQDEDGKPSPQGVYFYKATIISTNGSQQTKSGFVTLIE